MDILELVKLRNYIISILDRLVLDDAIAEKSQVISAMRDSFAVPEYTTQFASIVAQYTLITNQTRKIRDDVTNLVTQLEVQIEEIASRTYDKFETDIKLLPDELHADDNVAEHFSSRISLHTNWAYPGMYLRILDTRITDVMATCDPLYLVDLQQKTIDSVVETFNPVYQKKVRPYLITGPDMSALPSNQFSCIASFNLFNYFNITVITEYLTNIFPLLRPGGTFIFTYNNCELNSSARIATLGTVSWMTRKRMTQLAESIGYVVTGHTDVDNNHTLNTQISWIELTKPGELATIKIHPTLGKIRD